jgi:hypothetical protein
MMTLVFINALLFNSAEHGALKSSIVEELVYVALKNDKTDP